MINILPMILVHKQKLIRHISLCLILFSVSYTQIYANTSTETEWMTVLLDGRKVGHMQSTRAIDHDRVTSTEIMEISFERAGIKIPMRMKQISIETLDGKPLSFSTKTDMSGISSAVDGKINKNGTASITTTSFGHDSTQEINWPANIVLAEGIRLQQIKHGLNPNTTYQITNFDPSSMLPVTINITITGSETISMFGQPRTLIRSEEITEIAGTSITSTSWMTSQLKLQKMTMPMLGINLELLACSKTCAMAANQPTDILETLMIPAPRQLTSQDLNHTLHYALKWSNQTNPPDIVSNTEQTYIANTNTLSVYPQSEKNNKLTTKAEKPTAQDLQPNRWLQSNDVAIKQAAQKAVGEIKSSKTQMQTLENWVRQHINNKSMRVGYASALEVLNTREGDCTEHAVLLAALGRALNIPTRVVNGFAYAPAFAGQQQVFVPHAWTQAWIEDHWQSFDAALSGFDTGHIALAAGDGDASGFYSSVNLLGNLKIEKIVAE